LTSPDQLADFSLDCWGLRVRTDVSDVIPDVVDRGEPIALMFQNPFPANGPLSFTLPRTSRVSLKIYDISGRLVSTVYEGSAEAGEHSLSWDRRSDSGRTLSSGIYFMQLSTAEGSVNSKMIVLE
jgi:hypothetical protein